MEDMYQLSLAGICGISRLVKALFYDDTNLPVLLSSFAIGRS